MSKDATNNVHIACFLFVFVASFFTYMYNYTYPPNLFWDENYHIASAQKYLHGVYFMEPHPPLGKLFIAAGEWLLQPNVASDQFLNTNYATNIPVGFSFTGYRFFPSLFGWLLAPVLFGIFLLITKKPIWALLLSNLYIFDTSFIVHHRSAMLESTLHFFIGTMILSWLLLVKGSKTHKNLNVFAAICGISFGAVITTKANGLIMILLLPGLIWQYRAYWQKLVNILSIFVISTAFIFVSVWHIHFLLGKTIQPALPDNGYFQASKEYKQILAKETNGSLFNFPIMLRDSLRFLPHYARGVPALDLCKDSENGSPWFYWPVGGRSISYRWESSEQKTYRYLYLQANPASWGFGLLGVLGCASILFSVLFLSVKGKLKNPMLLLTFLGMYLSYLITMAQLERVMYLYHYMVPLLFAFILFGLLVIEVENFGLIKLNNLLKTLSLTICSLLVMSGFWFYHPFAYYEPINADQFAKRKLLPIWDLNCVGCTKERYMHVKMCS